MNDVLKSKLWNHFKKYFKKYSELNTIGFWITNSHDLFYIATEDGYLNGIHWQNFSDLNSVYKIMDAINLLKKTDNKSIKSICSKLEKIRINLNEEISKQNPLNAIYDEIYDPEKFSKLLGKIVHNLKKDFNWKYIHSIFVTINKDGSFAVQENERR